jgi:hypothetical protein
MDGLLDRCIPANPDISGIGVRTAIYARNLFSFGLAVVVLIDLKVTFIELHTQREAAIDHNTLIRFCDPHLRYHTNLYTRTNQPPCYNRPST